MSHPIDPTDTDVPHPDDDMPVDIKTVGSADLPPEPPEHDDPEGPMRGWSSSDFGPDDYVGDNSVIALTEPVADGRQTDVPDTGEEASE